MFIVPNSAPRLHASFWPGNQRLTASCVWHECVRPWVEYVGRKRVSIQQPAYELASLLGGKLGGQTGPKEKTGGRPGAPLFLGAPSYSSPARGRRGRRPAPSHLPAVIQHLLRHVRLLYTHKGRRQMLVAAPVGLGARLQRRARHVKPFGRVAPVIVCQAGGLRFNGARASCTFAAVCGAGDDSSSGVCGRPTLGVSGCQSHYPNACRRASDAAGGLPCPGSSCPGAGCRPRPGLCALCCASAAGSRRSEWPGQPRP
jgi:hypothetical protein